MMKIFFFHCWLHLGKGKVWGGGDSILVMLLGSVVSCVIVLSILICSRQRRVA